ncbi:MAG: hypothetical protein OEY14_15445, partial [Myxococcales bacterium]|nr:hypothetical protein [Myxococcales bacterium]
IPGLQDSDDCVGDDTRAPADQVCGGDPANFDNLVYDPAGGTCDPNTNSCVHDGTAGAEAGTACTLDTECEASGTCFADWGAAGTCSKFGCELAGNECAGAGVCHERRFGIGACVTGCQVASDADPADEATWLTSNGGCGDGFACYWDGISAAGAAVNGGCYGVDEPSTVTVNNLGDACLTDADCYSPFGFGRCLSEENYGFPGGFCFLDDCLAPGVPGTVCGAGNQCVDLDGTSGNATACFPGCTTADDCRPGYACLDLDGNPATANSACWISCSDSTECHFNEFCNPEGTCAPLCGNGVVDTTAGETCDSRGADTMACDADCTAPACGDGHTNRPAGEICDDGNTVDECPYGSVDCVGCAADCSAPIVGAYCGDGATDTADGETCDDGNTIDETACAYGTASCTTCNAACDGDLILTGAICGDGAIDAADGEACDDGNADACGGCTADCTAVSASPTGCAAGVGCTADADCTSGTCDPGTNTCA